MIKPSRLLEQVKLDFLTIPTHFMRDRQRRAEFHMRHVCSRCPQWRRDMRNVDGDGKCWWEKHWKREDFGIDPHFGVRNWFAQYMGWETDLSKWQKKDS